MLIRRIIAKEARRRGLSAEKLTKELAGEVPVRVGGRPRDDSRQWLSAARQAASLRRLRAKALIDVALLPARGPALQVDAASPAITIVQFSDLQCLYCRALHSSLKGLIRIERDVRVVFRHFPLEDVHPQAVMAAEVAWCAERHGRFWQFIDLAYAGAPRLDAENLSRLATRSGLEAVALERCLASGEAGVAVRKDISDAERLGVTGTPVMFLNGRAVVGGFDTATLSRLVARERAASRGFESRPVR